MSLKNREMEYTQNINIEVKDKEAESLLTGDRKAQTEVKSEYQFKIGVVILGTSNSHL